MIIYDNNKINIKEVGDNYEKNIVEIKKSNKKRLMLFLFLAFVVLSVASICLLFNNDDLRITLFITILFIISIFVIIQTKTEEFDWLLLKDKNILEIRVKDEKNYFEDTDVIEVIEVNEFGNISKNTLESKYVYVTNSELLTLDLEKMTIYIPYKDKKEK
jgi:hypothetical protein